MVTALLATLAFGAWLTDAPWLILMGGLTWGLHVGRGAPSTALLLTEVAGVLAAEGLLAFLRPKAALGPKTSAAALEGAALGGFTLLLGTVPGLVLWQASLGRDAVSRMRSLMRMVRREAMVRSVRVALGLVLVILYSSQI